MAIKFVNPEVTRYTLKDGEWVEFKNYLTEGERSAIQGAQFRGVRTGGAVNPTGQGAGSTSVEFDFKESRIAPVVVYLVAWSAKDFAGKAAQPTREIIESLDPDSFDEIKTALDEHIEKMEAAKQPGKKDAPASGDVAQ